ncbi:retrovirus-related pol polyprotein from transposon TNT 1-94 [Tanacetum coccineum]
MYDICYEVITGSNTDQFLNKSGIIRVFLNFRLGSSTSTIIDGLGFGWLKRRFLIPVAPERIALVTVARSPEYKLYMSFKNGLKTFCSEGASTSSNASIRGSNGGVGPRNDAIQGSNCVTKLNVLVQWVCSGGVFRGWRSDLSNSFPTSKELANEIVELKQSNFTIEVYYHKLKGLWDKIDAIEAPYACTYSSAQSVEIDRLKQTLSEHLKEKESLMQTVTLLKNDFKKEESRNIDREIALEKMIKQLDNILEPKLYDGNVIEKMCAIVIPDSEETLMLAEESHSKMLLKQKDPIMLEKKNSVNSPEPTLSNRPTKVEVSKELPKVSMVNTSLKKLKNHLAGFDVNVESVTNLLRLKLLNKKDFIEKETYDKLFRSFTTLEKHCISLEVDSQLNQEIFQRDNYVSNQSAPSFDQYFELNELKAQSQEKDTVIKKLKERIKSLSGNMNEDKIKKDLEEIETINIELDHRVSMLIAENEHLKQTYNIQEKVLVITALKDDLRKLKGKALVDNVVPKHIIDPEMLKIDVEPITPKLLNKRTAHSAYIKYTQEETAVLRDLVEHVKANYPLDPSLEFSCRYAKLIQELLTNISKTCPSINNTSKKLVVVNPKNKDKRVRFTEPVTSSGNTITKTASTSNLVSNKPMLSSTGVKPSTSASGSQPSGNTKKDKIQQTPSSTQKNKVEAHPRKVKSSLINKDCVVAPKGTANAQHSKLNVNSELKCVKCNGCMLFDNHDLYIWRHTGWTFTIVGNACPLTRITITPEVPLRKLNALESETPKPVITLMYSQKSRKSKTNVLVSKSKVLKSVSANKKEPSQSWGSIVFDVPSSSLDECRYDGVLSSRHGLVRGLPKLKFEKDHLCSACAMGKSKKKPHKPKSEDTNQEKLYLLHMDLCGPMRVASVNGKKYILVIIDDYSRFTWVKCLRSKDEAPDFIIKFLKMIQVWLKVHVRRIRTNNGTKFVNHTLREYYEKVDISHKTSVARSPQQNGVVERRNRTLIKAARIMLIYAKAPLFLWAEAVATACDTQNRSIIRIRHGKTPYEILHDKLSYLSFFHVFGALCYPTNDSENLDFDKLTTMASKHSSSGLVLHEMTPAIISSGLVPKPPPLTPFVPPSRTNWDILFQPLFDELLTPPPIDQDAPLPYNSQTTPETQPPIIPNNVEEDNHDLDVSHINNDPYFGIPIPAVPSDQSSSTDIIHATMHPDHQISEHNNKWTKDHPLENIIGELARPVSTRLQLHEQALFCYYDAFLTVVEPKTYKDALTQSCWIEAMQEELIEFERLRVWELVPQPDKVMVITLKWIYKVKLEELGGILKNNARLVARGYRQEDRVDLKSLLLRLQD